MAPSVELHIPASPNRRYANMLFFLLHSLADKAGFAGDWKAVITFGRDGDRGPDHPDFAWTRAFPVEFRQADPQIWAECEDIARRTEAPGYIYNATILEQFRAPFTADAVIFIDADTLVLRSLAPLIRRVLDENIMAAKPAWQPPPVDIAAILAHAGLTDPGPGITYSGYGWDFTEPRLGPPYFNGGFIASSRDMANRLQADLRADFRFVTQHYPGHYVWQIAQCLTMIRQKIAYASLDERYNFGIGADADPIVTGAEAAALRAAFAEQEADIHVLHYCNRTPNFWRNRIMGNDVKLRAFLDHPALGPGEAMLRDAFAAYRGEWERLLSPPDPADPPRS